MRDTSVVCTPLIKRAYGEEAARCPHMAEHIARFVRMRTCDDQALLRPYLVRLGYEVAGGGNWEAIAPVCAASEVLNISTYQANLAFDGKLNTVTHTDRAAQFACSMVSIGLAGRLLDECPAIAGIVSPIVSDMIAVNADLYRGQSIDLFQLTVARLADPGNFSATRRLYHERCRLLGGELTRWCLMAGALLCDSDSTCLTVLREIGTLMGTAGQMVNDIGDFVAIAPDSGLPPNGRYQKLFSDIKNGKATLPTIYAFEKGLTDVCDAVTAIANGCDDETLLAECASLMRSRGCFEAARLEVKTYRRRILQSIRQLPASAARAHLTLATSTLTNNKYFTALRLATGGADHA